MASPVTTKADAAKKERVNVSLSSDVLEALDSEAARRKMDRSALLTEYARTGLNGGIAPAPVVVNVPTAQENAAAMAALLPAGTAVDVAPMLAKVDDLGRKVTLIYQEALTQREMMIDRIAERYIDHGAKEADGVAAAQDAYAAAQAKAEKAMGLTR